MVIMLSIQGMAYVKFAKILIANLVQVKSTGHQTKQKFGFIKQVKVITNKLIKVELPP